jgi:hypothetical protein
MYNVHYYVHTVWYITVVHFFTEYYYILYRTLQYIIFTEHYYVNTVEYITVHCESSQAKNVHFTM